MENNIMKEITLDNFEAEYEDSIEQQQIDKFVASEMGRQIHRYIKGMSGSKQMMEKFESKLSCLSVPEKEEAIARYIDLNRKVTSGLDFKIVLIRSMANYCDTFDYLIQLVNNKRKMVYYLNRIKDKYIRYHEVFEENGKFGIKDHNGDVLVRPLYDFLRTCYVYVDDLKTMPIIAEKNGKMGLILPDGNDTVVADFIYDDISLNDEYPYFEVTKGKETKMLDVLS
jgi:ribosome biogenesis protein Nip4